MISELVVYPLTVAIFVIVAFSFPLALKPHKDRTTSRWMSFLSTIAFVWLALNLHSFETRIETEVKSEFYSDIYQIKKDNRLIFYSVNPDYGLDIVSSNYDDITKMQVKYVTYEDVSHHPWISISSVSNIYTEKNIVSKNESN